MTSFFFLFAKLFNEGGLITIAICILYIMFIAEKNYQACTKTKKAIAETCIIH